MTKSQRIESTLDDDALNTATIAIEMLRRRLAAHKAGATASAGARARNARPRPRRAGR